MTEPNEAPAAEPVTMPEREIEFHGRTIWVRMPGPEQLLVWKRTVSKLQNLQNSDWTGESVMAALERSRKIIDSVLVHEADKDWIDDQMLDRMLDLQDTAAIIQLTVEAFASDDNRESRRAAKKATRKKATRKAPR